MPPKIGLGELASGSILSLNKQIGFLNRLEIKPKESVGALLFKWSLFADCSLVFKDTNLVAPPALRLI